ncbi:MAG TPA: histidinol dehydrogenase [Myxococcota bacterium]|nr:histidinol dehydrogenase [Myxococcota bacterium]
MAAELETLDARTPEFDARFARLERRRAFEREDLQQRVAAIVEDVRRRGDAAVLEAIARFDGIRLDAGELRVNPAEIDAAEARLAPDDAAALALAADRIRAFHELHVPSSWDEAKQGQRLGQLVRPIEAVGMYVPNGVAPLASTTLMLGIPARIAGVRRRQMACPGRELPPAVLHAAKLAGVTAVYRVGGPPAIAAFAFGTESIPAVDKIVGPGSAYTQEAKRQVFGQVAIDAEAGPSEVFIVADDAANPEYIAADLLAQAEHDERASVVLATPSAALAQAVGAALERQLKSLPRAKIARASLREHSALIVTRDLAQACELANRYGAEHLELMVGEPERWLPEIRVAGAVFVGPLSPVPIGDYTAGPSHVLPTGGTARFFSVVGVEDFQRRISRIEIGDPVFEPLALAGSRLARLEGLEAHARALEIRLAPARRRLDPKP